MSAISTWHIFILLLIGAGILWPVAKILQKASYSRWWCLIWVVPILNIVALWIFATAKWPNLRPSSS
jgi:hypothetical protein